MLFMEANDEIARLSKEVAVLRQQMAELRQFIHIEERDDLPSKHKHMILRACLITLANPENANETQAMFGGGPEGPYLSLWGKGDRTRVLLQVEAEGPILRMYGQDLKQGAEMSVEDATSRGQMGVMEAGKPRAVLKATPTGGAVSVLHDDNHPRLMMHADGESGELIAVNQDLKTTVKITSDGLTGGMLTVHGSHGRALVALSGSDPVGIVMVKDAKGNIVDHLPRLPREE